MTDEVKAYAEQRLQETGFRMVPGHYPNFESKEHVDKWIAIVTRSFRDYFSPEYRDEDTEE